MAGWLRERSKARTMVIKFESFVSKLKMIVRVCEEIYFTKEARPKILEHRMKELKTTKIVDA